VLSTSLNQSPAEQRPCSNILCTKYLNAHVVQDSGALSWYHKIFIVKYQKIYQPIHENFVPQNLVPLYSNFSSDLICIIVNKVCTWTVWWVCFIQPPNNYFFVWKDCCIIYQLKSGSITYSKSLTQQNNITIVTVNGTVDDLYDNYPPQMTRRFWKLKRVMDLS
jgi:hypothetical protein